MISLTCTSCKKSLHIDDAFAGGVCRCQYCGTIQTVPSLAKLKRQSAPTAAAPAMAPAPYTPTPPRPQTSAGQPAPAGDGLDALAEAVATSSGLGRGSLRAGAALGGPAMPAGAVSAAAPQAPPAVPLTPVDYARPPRQPRRGPVLLIAGAIGGAVLLVVLGWVLFSGRSVVTGPGPTPTPPRTGSGTSGGGTTNNVARQAPAETIEAVAIPTPTN